MTTRSWQRFWRSVNFYVNACGGNPRRIAVNAARGKVAWEIQKLIRDEAEAFIGSRSPTFATLDAAIQALREAQRRRAWSEAILAARDIFTHIWIEQEKS